MKIVLILYNENGKIVEIFERMSKIIDNIRTPIGDRISNKNYDGKTNNFTRLHVTYLSICLVIQHTRAT